MRVEVDALYSIYPVIAKNILHESILRYFSVEIFKTKTMERLKVIQKESEKVREKMKEKLKMLMTSQ